MSNALVIIDVQNDYFPGGAMELVGSEDAAKRAKDLLTAFREKGLPVVHIQHMSIQKGATFFIPGTEGANIHPLVQPKINEVLFHKHYPNSFRDTPLLFHLLDQGITHLTFAGMMTHMCMDTTVRAAFDRGFDCTLAADACATRDLDINGTTVRADQVQQAFLAALNGVFAQVVSTKEIVAQL